MGLLPNFFLLGPPKTGTTALAEALGRHPDVFMSSPKEPNYFLYAGGNPYGLSVDRGVPDFHNYLRLFDCAEASEARIRGDASPYYIYAAHCAQEICRQAPDAKLMVILRNPVERAFSMYRYWYKDAPDFRCDPEDFRQKFLSRSLVTDSGQGKAVPPMEWLQDMGRYADMIERYDEHFSPEQIMLLRYEDMSADPAGTMARILKFLDVDPRAAPELRQANVTFEPSWRALNYWLNFAVRNPARRLLVASLHGSRLAVKGREIINRANRRPVPTTDRPLPPAIYNELIQVYADDLRRLAKRASLDLSDWLGPRDGAGRVGRASLVSSTAATTPAPSGLPFVALRRWWSRISRRLAIRNVTAVALLAGAVAYWIWPSDLIPDATEFGRVDDVLCLAACCVLAGRLAWRRPV